jgi:bacterioferritin-associated ferredoxin
MSCNGIRKPLHKNSSQRKVSGAAGNTKSMYVCNCNGIRERDVNQAIQAGAQKPADVFRHCQGAAQCAKCVCDMRCMIQASRQALSYAAE